MRRWWNEKDYIGLIQEKTFTKELTLNDAVEFILADVTS